MSEISVVIFCYRFAQKSTRKILVGPRSGMTLENALTRTKEPSGLVTKMSAALRSNSTGSRRRATWEQ